MLATLSRCLKGYGGRVLSRCKYGFPFKTPQLKEELDRDEVCYVYVRRCKKDSSCSLQSRNPPVLGSFHEHTVYAQAWL